MIVALKLHGSAALATDAWVVPAADDFGLAEVVVSFDRCAAQASAKVQNVAMIHRCMVVSSGVADELARYGSARRRETRMNVQAARRA
jgi:hypothetical protein